MSALSVKPIPTLIHYTRSFEYMMVMKLQSVKLIPTRNWRNKNFDLVVERDKNRKKSQLKVDERIHYMWFNYLKLCLNLEEINYSVKKKGAKGKVLGETGVKVNKKIYKDWDLKDLYTMNFKKWYKDPKHQKLFTEGGFKPQSRARYHSLVKRYNVFIEYYNGMESDYGRNLHNPTTSAKGIYQITDATFPTAKNRLKPEEAFDSACLPTEISKESLSNS